MSQRLLPLLAALLLLAAPHARAETPQQSYEAALAALAKGADNDAIDRLELLADQGVVNADASGARAAAYLSRADGPSAQPGDLGRAAAALSEALLLKPDDAQAERALEAVQAEIARRHSKERESVVVRPRLGRAIVALLDEQVWAILAALSALAVSIGVVTRRLAKSSLARLTGLVAIGVGSLLTLGFGCGAYAAEEFRVSSQPAVIVVPEARLTNETGRPLPSKRGADTTTVPEGATVYVRERREGRCLVEWGSTDGWLSLSEVRILASR
ncbi:MAG TPA: hypothetical protein VEQ58_20340 [Polyangiaceae bacterium]|nr:hypothetical protein [Polyangiaceae bacterium]